MHVFDGLDLGLLELVALREEALGDAALAQAEVPSARPPVMRSWMPWAGSALAASIVAALLLVGQPAPHTGQPGGDALIAEKRASTHVRVAGGGNRTGNGQEPMDGFVCRGKGKHGIAECMVKRRNNEMC